MEAQALELPRVTASVAIFKVDRANATSMVEPASGLGQRPMLGTLESEMIEFVLEAVGFLIAIAIGESLVVRVFRNRERRYDRDGMPAALRLQEGRWEMGLVYRGDRGLAFHRLRGKRDTDIDLRGTRVTGTRPRLPSESVWFVSPTVLVCSGAVGASWFELGVDHLHEAALRRSIAEAGWLTE